MEALSWLLALFLMIILGRNAWATIRKRAKAAGFLTPVGCHTWRGNQNHHLPGERRTAGARPANGGTRVPANKDRLTRFRVMGLCPKPRVWGELIIFRRRRRKHRKKKILEPSTLERHTPVFALG